MPKRLQSFLERPRSELIEPLGGDRRTALRLHPAAVARLQQQLAEAARRAGDDLSGAEIATSPRAPITLADFGHAVWQRYSEALETDETARHRYPPKVEIDAARNKFIEDNLAGEVPANFLAILDAAMDTLLLQDARNLDRYTREARLKALQRELAAGETHQVEHEIEAYLEQHELSAPDGSSERTVLASQMMRAEIEALRRTLERDQGDYTGRPFDPIVKPPAQNAPAPVKLSQLWLDYRNGRVQASFLKDKGRRQEPVIRNLQRFLKHDDARRIAKRDLIAWREHFLGVDKPFSQITTSPKVRWISIPITRRMRASLAS